MYIRSCEHNHGLQFVAKLSHQDGFLISWCFEDAALLVREGYDNEEFSTRPQGVWSTRAYAVVHNPVWYWTNFATALALMGLAVIEEPSALPQSQTVHRAVSQNTR